MYKFSKNEDSVQIDVVPLSFQEGQYPILSFCLSDPFIESKLKKYNESLTIVEYKKILLGLSSYKGIENINIDDVTIDLADYYLGFNVKLNNGSSIKNLYPDVLQLLPKVTYSGFAYGCFMKCVGLDSKLTNIDAINLKFNSSIYPKGIRPSSLRSQFSTVVAFHLPNQFFLIGNSRSMYMPFTWPDRTQKNAYRMYFSLQQIDILKRRNKQNDPCIPEGYNFDQILLDDYLEEVGCKAPYHRTNKSLEICVLKEKMKEASFELLRTKKQMKACTTASILTFKYDEAEIYGDGADFFLVSLEYPNEYRETRMVQAIDIQTVIGNAGGYIGLFLGEVMKDSMKMMDVFKH